MNKQPASNSIPKRLIVILVSSLFLIILKSQNVYAAGTFTFNGIDYEVLEEAVDNKAGKCIVIGAANHNIKKLVIPCLAGPALGQDYEIIGIKEGAFKNYKKLKSVSDEADCSLEYIANDCFKGCKNLRYVYFESLTLRKIGKNAFKGCKKLECFDVYSQLLKKNSFGKNSFSGTKKGLLVRNPKLKTAKKYAGYMKKQGATNPKGALALPDPGDDD
ncbi:leucine-rich repeat protein [Butyrivibrio sp. INlla16]|uniref:leucine-rich repeat protein n=1 Tax=Butyrivibrio sp. INlla16 TaxID=1520807 RepID=UPI000882EB84|nr:leucine-rich repeat protein [Butyrivibrio sp. INlla16]SDB58342.1 Leucine rich repeat-containing protein [Butyrivibrio sp. INlla16]